MTALPQSSASGTTLRTRFAPSPTGGLHLGGIRTALFNYLLTKKRKGVFILRFEDTDLERSKEEFIQQIEIDLVWLGLKPDESDLAGGTFGPYRQSNRGVLYDEKMRELAAREFIYPCFCSKERLAELKRQQQNQRLPPRYDGKCARLAKEEVKAKQAAGELHTWRFRIARSETDEVSFEDLVHSTITFKCRDLEDFIMKREDGTFPFIFCSLLDDLKMEVSHVLRGEDHLSNTPKQILLARALGAEPPHYGHLPLMVDDKGAPLSKRLGSLQTSDLRDQGLLPEAITQALLFCGWSPKAIGKSPALVNSKAWSLAQQIEHFAIEGVSRSPSRMDVANIRVINRWHLQSMETSHLLQRLQHYVDTAELDETPALLRFRSLFAQPQHDQRDLEIALELIKGEAETLSEILPLLMGVLFGPDPGWSKDEDLHALDTSKTRSILKSCAQNLPALGTENNVDAFYQAVNASEATAKPEFYAALRLAFTGRPHGARLKDLLHFLGRDRTLKRLTA